MAEKRVKLKDIQGNVLIPYNPDIVDPSGFARLGASNTFESYNEFKDGRFYKQGSTTDTACINIRLDGLNITSTVQKEVGGIRFIDDNTYNAGSLYYKNNSTGECIIGLNVRKHGSYEYSGLEIGCNSSNKFYMTVPRAIDALTSTTSKNPVTIADMNSRISSIMNSSKVVAGSAVFAGDNKEGTVTLPSPMPNADYKIVTGIDVSSASGNSDFYGLQIKSRTTTTFNYIIRCSGTWRGGNINYIAIA